MRRDWGGERSRPSRTQRRRAGPYLVAEALVIGGWLLADREWSDRPSAPRAISQSICGQARGRWLSLSRLPFGSVNAESSICDQLG